MGGQRSGKGMVRRLAVLLGSAALLLPLAEPVGQRTGALARYLLAMAATATPAQAQTIETLPGVVVDSTSLNTVDEGGTATSYTVKLNTDPGSSTATVTPTSGDTGALAVSPASLTFTTSDWSTGKTVTVTSVEDDDLRNETVTISHSASGYGSVTSADAVTVAVTDDDVPAVSMCDRTAEVQPSILAKISGITNCADVSTIHLRNITGGLRFRSGNLSSLQENDFAGLSSLEILWLLNNNSLSSLPEGIFDGLSALTQLQLEGNSLSSLDVDIFADLSNLEGLSLKNNALSSLPEGIFNGLSSLNWISFHTNPLESLPGNIFHGLANLQRLNFYNNNLSSLDADIFNGLANLQEIDLYSNSLSSLPEGIFNNLTSLQKLYLNSNSLGSLSEDVFSGLSNLDTLRLDNNSLNSLDADIFAGLSSLQYLYFNDNNLRSLPEGIFAGLSSLLQVFLANNNLVCLPRSVASDSDLALDSATVTLPDCFGVSLSVTPTEVQEGNDGESITVSATLRAGQRTSSVATEVSISVAGGTAAEGMDFTAVDNFTITIPSGSESATGTFTLMATADNVAEPGGETVLVSGASVLSSSSVPGTEVSDATVTIKDGPGVNMEPTNVNAEEGRTASYTVKLITLPAGNVTITPTSGDSGMVSVSPASLTFATSDWNTFQTVSVTAAEDGDGGDETVTISHSVSGYGSLTAAPAVTVTVTDDDAPEVSVCDRTNKVQERILEKISDRTDCAEVSVAELNGITGRLSFYFARLGSFQKDDFADLSSLQELSLTGNSLSSLDAAIFADLAKLEQLELNRNSLTSLPANTFNGLSNLENLNLASNSLNNLDANIFNDLSKLKQLYLSSNNLSNLSGNIFNGLSNLEELYLFSNSLNSLSVDIFAGLTNLQELFLYDNNLSSLPDDIFNGLSNLEGLSLAGGENDLVCLPTSVPWNRVALNQLTLSSELPDCFRLSLSVTPTALEEGSGEESITVSAALSAGPRGRRVPTQVTISVAGDTATEGTDFTAVDDFIITIANGSESATGTFTLTATADEVAEPGGETVLVSGTSTEMFPLLSGGSGEYAAEVSSATLTIQEAPGVSITPPTLALTVNESGSGSYTLQLNTQPAGAVTITPVNSDSSVVSVSPPNLTFTPSNWDTPRPVSVTPVDDNTASENRTVTVSHGVSGYGSVTAAAAVTVTVTDDDIPGVNMQPTSMGPVVEGETASYTLQLNTQPAGAVTITPVNSDSSVVSVSPPNLTFTRSNWNTPQTVSVTPVDDNTASENRTVTVSHGVSGYGSVTAAAAVTVTVTDDDIPGVNMQPTSVGPVVEGETASYTLQLNTQPAGAVTITPVNSDSGAVSLSPASITFTPSNWNTAQTVSVTGVQDDDTDDETLTLSHSVSGYGGVTAAAAVTVSVTDDDTAPTPSPGDATSPLVTIMNVPPTSSTPFTATITFNEVVSGFMVDDITAVNATLSDFTEATTGEATSGTAWTVLVTPRADGLVTLDVAMNVAEDAAGNGNAAAAQAHSTYTAPARETEAAQEAKAVLNQVILPDVLQQLTAETTEVVTSRLNTIASGSPGAPPSLSLDDVVADTVAAIYGEREHLKDGSLDWRQALSGRDFVLPLSGFNLAQSDSTGTQDNPFSSLALWGGGNYASYRNIIENTDVDGNGFSAVIGMDLQPIPQLTTGLALTTTRWGLDYLTDANGTRAEGTYEIGVIMVNPYVNWLATEQLSLWGTFGYGHGEVEQDPEDGNATTRTDGLTSWAGGLRFEVVPGVDPRTGEGAPFGLAFKADGATSSFLEMSVQLARLAAEVSHSFSIEDGLLNVALELGWRLRSVSDNSNLDGQQLAVTEQNDGSGAELAGNLNWRNTDGSLSATVDTRVLLGSGHHREWGIGGHLRFTPSRRNGEGLSLSLQPSFGVTGTRLDELWSLSSNDDLAIHNDHPVAWLDAQLAYGFPLGNAILNPYTELRWEEAANTYGAGLRYGLNPSLELDLKGTHHHNANGTTENRLLLQMRSDF